MVVYRFSGLQVMEDLLSQVGSSLRQRVVVGAIHLAGRCGITIEVNTNVGMNAVIAAVFHNQGALFAPDNGPGGIAAAYGVPGSLQNGNRLGYRTIREA